MGSRRFEFNRADLLSIGRLSLSAGSAAALITLLEWASQLHFGQYDAIASAVLTIAIQALQRWVRDTSGRAPTSPASPASPTSRLS